MPKSRIWLRYLKSICVRKEITMTTEISHEFVLEHVQGIVNLMKKIFPHKEGRAWIAALKKPDVMENLTYMGYIYQYYDNHVQLKKKKNYDDRIEAYCEKEYLLDIRVENNQQKEKDFEEKKVIWRHITKNMRLDMIEQKGCNEFDRWVNETLGNVPAYYGL